MNNNRVLRLLSPYSTCRKERLSPRARWKSLLCAAVLSRFPGDSPSGPGCAAESTAQTERVGRTWLWGCSIRAGEKENVTSTKSCATEALCGRAQGGYAELGVWETNIHIAIQIQPLNSVSLFCPAQRVLYKYQLEEG